MKKTILTKILIFSFIFTILLTIFIVPCFADSSNGIFTLGDTIVFKKELSSSFIPSGDQELSFHVYDDSNIRIDFVSMSFQYRGYIVVIYNDSLGNGVEVYNQDGWVSEFYRTVFIDNSIVLDGSFKGFIDINSDSSIPIFDTLFDLLCSTFFGNRQLDSIEKLSITLLCLVICVAIVLLPIIIAYGICIALSRIGMRFI